MMKFNKFSLPPEVSPGRAGQLEPSPAQLQTDQTGPLVIQPDPACPQAFYMIRFHSFYPWHTGGDYRQLCNEQDLAMLPWVQEFKCVTPRLGWEGRGLRRLDGGASDLGGGTAGGRGLLSFGAW